MNDIAAIHEQLATGRLTLFLGADLPAALTGLPSRADLAAGLAQRHGLPAGLSLAAAAQRVMQRGNRFAFTDYLGQRLDPLSKPPQPIYQLIAQLATPIVITTAYDNLLEQAFQQAGAPINRIVRDSDLAFADPHHRTLIKLYGDLQQRDTLVVTEDDHYGLWRSRDKEGILDEVRRAMRGNAVLFLGYNLADPDFLLLWREVLDRMGRFALGAYAVGLGMSPDERCVWEDRQVRIIDLEPLALLAQLAAPAGADAPPIATESVPKEHSAMPTAETIAQQQQQLLAHRRTLAILLGQQAQLTAAYAPPHVAHGIAEARAAIARIKAILRGWAVLVDDEPSDDERESGPAQPAAAPAPSVGTSAAAPTAPMADVLLVTVTEVEARAVLDQCQAITGQAATLMFRDDNTYHNLGRLGGARTFMVQSEMGVGGPGGALLTVQEGIRALAPAAVIMVGIAFGLDPQDQQIGDILVARQLLGYELQRVGTGANGAPIIRARGDRPSASTRLLDRCRAGALAWHGPPLHFGLMLSGEKLVDNQGFRDQLRQIEPEAIGGEMEGAGLYAAAQRSKVDWILVKAICDWADGNKHVGKREQQYTAAQNAASFVLHVIQQGGFVRG